MESGRPFDRIIHSLQERAKELNCLYRIDELLGQAGMSLEEILRALIEVIPAGWQYPGICRARIVHRNKAYEASDFVETGWLQSAPIEVQDEVAGRVDVVYLQPTPAADGDPFLEEERRLLGTIASRIGQTIQHRTLRAAFEAAETRKDSPGRDRHEGWRVILEFLRVTDKNLLQQIARKMINQLVYSGIGEAQELLSAASQLRTGGLTDDNQPSERETSMSPDVLLESTFRIASKHLSEATILASIQKWIKEDNVAFLGTTLESLDSPLVEVAEALERFRHSGIDPAELSLATQIGLKVALIRRLFTDRIEYIGPARSYLDIDDFIELFRRILVPPRSRGKLGGKSAGLILAEQVIRKSREYSELLGEIKIPRTWFIPSDLLLQFVHHNDLEDVYNWKYQDADLIRQEYPHLVQVFKNSAFPAEIMKALAIALDDVGERPLIVRSSSLLEDRLGSAFSGKYKSLFLANKGTRSERLAALADAIAEVYASVFGPDPIEYRAERGLLYYHEEMGVMIQEVVGTTIGPYFLPAFSGVALSNNELRWSPRIRREDGLLRLVPGIGTRAVDRLGDDYPVLVALGQPGLRANVTADEVARYSPTWVDVINLESRRFESIRTSDLLRDHADTYPGLRQMVSIVDGDRIRRPVGLDLDLDPEKMVFTFDGLVANTTFVTRMQGLMKLLAEATGSAVDIEFASDGRDLYLLQCRPQSYGDESSPDPIPRDIPEDRVVFTGRKYISNGKVPEITHVVYISPERYAELASEKDMREVGRAVGKLNRLLPKRQFILMGPGRWGSRGDIRLGVSVSYADINNTAALVEIARKKGNYVPDLSFGTHFFQDLVEASIRYLPLYPDDPGVQFNLGFLERSPSVLKEILPGFSHLSETVRVIDVPGTADGQILRILTNGDLQEAVAMLAQPGEPDAEAPIRSRVRGREGEEYWRWRLGLAERIASQLDGERFGVKGFYVFGSTKNATAGPASDIDIIIHFSGTPAMRESLEQWLEGWSLCLAEMNRLRTGYRSPGGLLDSHIITDADIACGNSYAAKIGAASDAARPLPLKGQSPPES